MGCDCDCETEAKGYGRAERVAEESEEYGGRHILKLQLREKNEVRMEVRL